MRRRIFIAGPITKGDLCANLNQATEAFVALAKAGFAPFCPMWSVYSKPAKHIYDVCHDEMRYLRALTNIPRVMCEATALGNDEMAHGDWMAVSLPWVAASDAVLRLSGESAGADLETAFALARGIPAFSSVELLKVHFGVV